jgi:hypothetical protein
MKLAYRSSAPGDSKSKEVNGRTEDYHLVAFLVYTTRKEGLNLYSYLEYFHKSGGRSGLGAAKCGTI